MFAFLFGEECEFDLLVPLTEAEWRDEFCRPCDEDDGRFADRDASWCDTGFRSSGDSGMCE
jgi:hypothetical protein